MHADPARPWTVPELAAVSGLSRAAFARIFQLALGQAPMQYLTEWRMTLARDHLRAGELTLALVQGLFYLSIGLVFGVRLRSGIAGGLVLILLAAVIALGFAAFGAYAALRTGSTEAVNGLFPLFFVFLFISSMNIPRNLMGTTWFRWLATINPVSYLIEGVRSLVIAGWDGEALGLAFGIGLGVVVAGFGLAAAALPQRMART